MTKETISYTKYSIYFEELKTISKINLNNDDIFEYTPVKLGEWTFKIYKNLQMSVGCQNIDINTVKQCIEDLEPSIKEQYYVSTNSINKRFKIKDLIEETNTFYIGGDKSNPITLLKSETVKKDLMNGSKYIFEQSYFGTKYLYFNKSLNRAGTSYKLTLSTNKDNILSKLKYILSVYNALQSIV